jgi:uncharacterized protein (DUF4415 family)
MAKQPVAGISGVLGGLISSPSSAQRASDKPTKAEHASSERTAEPVAESQPRAVPVRNAAPKATARRGRPPGRTTGSSPRKAKVTLRVDAGLMDDYREWSWAQRCQLGELVERALANYRRLRA